MMLVTLPSQGFSSLFPMCFPLILTSSVAGFTAEPQSILSRQDCGVEWVRDAGRRLARSCSAAGTPQSQNGGLGAFPLAALSKVTVSQLFLWCWQGLCRERSPFLPPCHTLLPLIPDCTPRPSRTVPSFVWLCSK